MIVAVGNDGQFAKFCAAAGCGELAQDARFAKNSARVRHRAQLVPLLEDRMRHKPVAFWTEALERAGVPCGPINSIAQALADPQIRSRGLQFTLPHPRAGEVPQVASPIRMGAKSAAAERPPPLLGEHSGEVLSQLAGLSAADLARLRSIGVVGAAPSLSPEAPDS